MKKTTASNHLRRAAAFLLALLLAVPTGYARAGDRKLQTSSALTEGLTYYNTITENAGSRVESFSLELSPSSAAYPILLQGSGTVYGAASITKAVAYAQSLGYHVLGAVNTDFFDVHTGVPFGIVIEDGVYKSSSENEGAMVIVDGRILLVESPEVTLTLTNQRTGTQVQPRHLNKGRSATGGLYLLNQDFSATTTQDSGAGWHVRMRLVDPGAPSGGAVWPDDRTDTVTEPGDPNQTDPEQTEQSGPAKTGSEQTDGQEPGDPTDPIQSETVPPKTVFPQPGEPTGQTPRLTVNSTLTLEVLELIKGDQPIDIGPNEYILTAGDESGYMFTFQYFQVGDRVTLTASCADPVLSAAQWACGMGDVMLRDGALTDSSNWTYVKSGRAPRTALGVKADGTTVIYTVDGRQSGYSMGLSQIDLAQELQALGCQWAVNLDGGGSTAVSVWVPGQESISLRNKPSDGVQRGCATYLLLVTDDAGDGQPSRLALREDNLVALAGSRLTLPEAAVLDSGLNVLPMQADGLTVFSNGLGMITDNIYTAGPRAGTDKLTLSSPWFAAAGSAQIHIVPSLTGLTVSREGSAAALSALSLRPGETAQLAVTGAYWGRTALRDFSAVTWTVEGGVGVIDENGLFTMNEDGASGSITAHAGGLSQTIQVATPYTHSDVTKEYWAYTAVEYCYGHGVVNGISPTEFGPENLVSRGDFVLMLYRAAGKPQVTAPCTFTDVAPDAYYADALAWAQSAGLTAGGGDGIFRPGEPATREEAFTILRQVMPLLGKQCPDGSLTVLEQFGDRGQIAEYALGSIATLVTQGIVNGRSMGIDPKGTLTRAEMATLVYKVLTFTPVIDDPVWPVDPAEPGEPVDPAEPVEPGEPSLPDPGQDVVSEQYTLTMDRTEVSLAPAESVTLQALLDPVLEDAEIVWSSSDPAAAPVTQQGVVTNIHPSEEGTQVVVTASWNGQTVSCLVQCQPAVFIGTVTGADTGLNVRAAAGTDQPITGGLANGSKVVVVAITKSGWYHIHYLHQDGYAAEGYVSGDYLVLNRS
ncbi:MAG: S-layer homology domain-containing protein [Oscillospiraceae bacterium]|nr:S-layer homology domain-containing protein [Oscillospiraceae bacterium]